MEGTPLGPDELRKVDAYWRANLYLCLGMLYLKANPLPFPGGIGSHATPETPGSIHEGGELGYSVSHAYGAAYDHPDLIALVMVRQPRPLEVAGKLAAQL